MTGSFLANVRVLWAGSQVPRLFLATDAWGAMAELQWWVFMPWWVAPARGRRIWRSWAAFR